MSAKKINIAVREAREKHNLKQQELADIMGVTAQTISQIELGKQKPSPMFLNFFCFLFRLDLSDFHEKPNEINYQKIYKRFGTAIIGLGALLPFLPGASTAILGVTAATVITRMKEAYGAKTDKELGEKLNVGKNSICNWKRKNSVPHKYIELTAEKTLKPIEWIMDMKSNTSQLSELITLFEEKLISEGISVQPETKGQTLAILFRSVQDKGEIDPDEIDNIIQSISIKD